MPTFVVTGASGFIGRNLVRALAKDAGNVVFAIVHNDKSDISQIRDLKHVKIFYCDLKHVDSLFDSLRNETIQSFFHLAWEGSTGPARANYALQMENVIHTANTFVLAERLGCRKFLCAGTISENLIEQIGELKTVSQNLIYALAKKTAYDLLSVLAKESQTQLVWMRFSNVYGPGNRSGNLISYAFEEFRNNRTPQFGSGLQPYNFIYIDDLIQGICCLEREILRKNSYFIGTEEVKPLREFLMEIPAALGGGLKIELGKRPDDGLIYHPEWFDISDLKNETEFEAEYSFEKGVRVSFASEEKERIC